MAKREIRPVRVVGQVAYVPLTKGYTAIIDASDIPLVCGHNWCAILDRRKDGSIRQVYAGRTGDIHEGRKTILMHRVILAMGNDMDADHKDRDGLNNRRGNLRVATKSQNQHNKGIQTNNTSGCKGVSVICNGRRWMASISYNGKSVYLGLFKCRTAAAIAYARASSALHGEFGRVA